MMEVEEAECCPICCTEYPEEDNPHHGGEHARIVCSGRCRTFSMCRLCVHRQSSYLAHPFVVDDDTGDFTTLDPTKCPQCNESGAFKDADLPPLSDEVMAIEVEEARNRRDGVAAAMLARALSRLNEAPLVRFDESSNDRMEEDNGDNVIRRINGSDMSIVREDDNNLWFGPLTASAGLPHLFTTSGVLYFEVSVESGTNDALVGLSLADGMDDDNIEDVIMGVGYNNKSWGLDLIHRGFKFSGGESFGTPVKPNWDYEDIIGVAVNVDKGMIAVSTNGNWELTDGNGVAFEDTKIKAGVYPVLSASKCRCNWRFQSDELAYGPPPESVWGLWPKYEDIHWIKLPIEARAAAIRLGYTQSSWSDNEDNPTEQKTWNELSPEEQSAANVLGYNEIIWTHITTAENDDDDSNDEDESFDDEDDSGNDRIDTFNDLRWDALPSDARQAAETLNFTPTSWDEDAANSLMEKDWEELSDDQKRAAILLGYDQNMWGKWDDDDDNDYDSSASSADLPFEHMRWADLPGIAKEAARKLGYTEQLWNNDEAGPLEDTPFNDLTTEQQFACAALGYTETHWDCSVHKRLGDAIFNLVMSNFDRAMDSTGSNRNRHR